MNARTPPPERSKEQEIAEIEESLDLLLRAILDSRLAPPPRPIAELIINGNDLCNWLGRPKLQRDIEEMARNPVGWACRKAVRLCGKRLYEIGGLGLMGEVLDRVAERDPANWGRRTDIMDKRWDGIGFSDNTVGWVA